MEKFTADVISMNSGESEYRASRGLETTIEFALALVERLYGKEKMEEVDRPLISCK